MMRLRVNDKRSSRSGQAALEYLIIAGVIILALVATNFVGRMRNNFDNMFDKAVEKMR
jgi:Flp pilus assembly pilin Flp